MNQKCFKFSLIINIILFSISSCTISKKIDFNKQLMNSNYIEIDTGINTNSLYINSEQSEFEEILIFINKQEFGWKTCEYDFTFTSPKYRLFFKDENNNLIKSFWVGDGWIGTKENNELRIKYLENSEFECLKIIYKMKKSN